MKRLLVLSIVLSSVTASAQQVELAPIIGYTTPVTLDRTTQGVDELKIDDGITWGVRGTYLLTPRLGLEAMWTYQPTEMRMSTPGGTAVLFEMSITQFYGNVAYEFGNSSARLRPFVFGGAGATFFDAPDLTTEAKLTWDAGGGMKWFLQQHLGIEGRVRYKPTQLSESDELCGPFDFCQGTLRSVDVTTAFLVRF